MRSELVEQKIVIEGGLGRDLLIGAIADDFAGVDPIGELVKARSPSPKMRLERGGGRLPKIVDFADAERVEAPFGDLSDPRDAPHGLWREKIEHLLGAKHEEPIGLILFGGHLREKLVGGDASRGRE